MLCAGLDACLQQYEFEQWQLCGVDLLQLSSQHFKQLGVHKIGHQELILDAVEKLCSLVPLPTSAVCVCVCVLSTRVWCL